MPEHWRRLQRVFHLQITHTRLLEDQRRSELISPRTSRGMTLIGGLDLFDFIGSEVRYLHEI